MKTYYKQVRPYAYNEVLGVRLSKKYLCDEWFDEDSPIIRIICNRECLKSGFSRIGFDERYIEIEKEKENESKH